MDVDNATAPASAEPTAAASVPSSESMLDTSAPAAASSSGSGTGEKKSAKRKFSKHDPSHRDGKRAPSFAPKSSRPLAVVGEGQEAASDAAAAAPSPPQQQQMFVSLFYPLRKQSQPDRISTVEALVLLLMELHEPPAVTYGLLDLLRLLVDSMRAQSGMRGVYGFISEERGRAMRIELANVRKKAGEELLAARLAAGSAGADAAAGNSSAADPAHLRTKQERRSRAKVSRPCLQWNRGLGQPCPGRRSAPEQCRYAHVCLVCGESSHRAAECSHAHAQQWLADRMAGEAHSGAADKKKQKRAAEKATPSGAEEA